MIASACNCRDFLPEGPGHVLSGIIAVVHGQLASVTRRSHPGPDGAVPAPGHLELLLLRGQLPLLFLPSMLAPHQGRPLPQCLCNLTGQHSLRRLRPIIPGKFHERVGQFRNRRPFHGCGEPRIRQQRSSPARRQDPGGPGRPCGPERSAAVRVAMISGPTPRNSGSYPSPHGASHLPGCR